jgi:hypothetical protein
MSGLLQNWKELGVFLIITVVGGGWCNNDKDYDNYDYVILPSHFHT